jgi:hypothetical protein
MQIAVSAPAPPRTIEIAHPMTRAAVKYSLGLSCSSEATACATSVMIAEPTPKSAMATNMLSDVAAPQTPN